MKLFQDLTSGPTIKAGDIVTLLIGGPRMVVGVVQKGKDGATDYADCYYVNKVTGMTCMESVDSKYIAIGALKLCE